MDQHPSHPFPNEPNFIHIREEFKPKTSSSPRAKEAVVAAGGIPNLGVISLLCDMMVLMEK